MKKIGMTKKQKKFHSKESFLHKSAKQVLRKWLLNNSKLVGLNKIHNIQLEREFCMTSVIKFIPDLTIYDQNGVKLFIEIEHKNPVTDIKILIMKNFLLIHKWENIKMIEISAYWIMNQIEQPKELKTKKIIEL